MKGFPILGGRLLKDRLIAFYVSQGEFPILGGRLLKLCNAFSLQMVACVSNPWREAIEAIL